MTESEWLCSHDAWQMLHFLRDRQPSERKVRLLNAAICRRWWNYLPDDSRRVLEESELLADGLVSISERELCGRANVAVGRIDRQYPDKKYPTDEVRIQREAAAAVCYAVLSKETFGAAGRFWDLDPAEKAAHAGLIRDIFGNPFDPVELEPAWLADGDSRPAALARSIYDSRHAELMPKLAETLIEAGCANAAVIEHCQSSGPHVRGCWVLDLLLRQE